MEVKLIGFTTDKEWICALAMRSCHTVEPAHEIKLGDEERVKREQMERLIRTAKEIKHYSVLEHANFTFSVGGVSRALTHQLVRHRLASYSQQSQRYVKLDEPTYVTPEPIKGMMWDSGVKVYSVEEEFNRMMDQAWVFYNWLIEAGAKPEDARFVLPNACTTNIVITMNARELLHFFHLRTSKHAQWEIRELANRMLKRCREIAPIIFEGDPKDWE